MITIKIATDFSDTPGGRKKTEGKHSGEEFKGKVLQPKFNEAMENHEKLLVDLDGCYGFPSSFLDESFGELAREYAKNDINIVHHIEFKSDDQPSLVDDIIEIMKG